MRRRGRLRSQHLINLLLRRDYVYSARKRLSMPIRPGPRVILFVLWTALVCVPATSHAQTPSPSPSTQIRSSGQSSALTTQITIDDALRLANAQASAFRSAALNERIAAEDVRQAQAAFLPKISAPLSYIYTTPALGLPPGEPRGPSFVSSDGIGVYDALVNVSGDFDIGGRLRSTVTKNRALLAAAHAGTEVARRALNQAVVEAYYGLALASAQRRAGAGNLSAAEEFEHVTSLLFSGGEVAAVDLTRAQLQTLTRRNELEKARVEEEVAAATLRILVGYEFSRPINTTDLSLTIPTDSEYQQYKPEDVTRRPEFIQ